MTLRTDVVSFLAVAASALALAGCGPTVVDGVRSVFSASQLCTAANVTVKARPDLAPHSVLNGVTPPPGQSLDSVGDAYEVSGCNTKRLYVCGHPFVGTHADPFSASVSPDGIDMSFNTSDFSLFTSHDIQGGRITSAVVCQPSAQTIQ
jgi:hypothetical protein